MKAKTRIAVLLIFLVALGIWAWLFFTMRETHCVFFPQGPHSIYALDDKAFGGSSTSELEVSDSALSISVNVRSGVAYPAIGAGLNLNSSNNRPVGLFDFTKYDTLELSAATDRMQSVTVRILTDDPVYTKEGFRETLRPLVVKVPAARSVTTTKIPLTGFSTAVWWLAAMGLEEDDGFTYLYRARALEIVNGDGIMRGMPDGIEVRAIRAWGIDRDFENVMIAVLVALVVFFALVEMKLFGVLNRKDSAKPGRKHV